MSYLIKIKDHLSETESVINKKTCLKNWKNDFLSVFKVLSENEDCIIDLNIENHTMNILKREKILKKGYIYNTSNTVNKTLYSLTLIKLEMFETLTSDASTETINQTHTFGGQVNFLSTSSSTSTSTATTQTTQTTQETQDAETNYEETTYEAEDSVLDHFDNKYKYDDRMYPHDYFYSEDDSCSRFDYFTKIYNPSYKTQEAPLYQDFSHYYQPVPTAEIIDIRIDNSYETVPLSAKDELINELKTKLHQPNFGLNYSNGYKLL
jgi:hypothetical protein